MADEKLINHGQLRDAMEAVAAEIDEAIEEYAQQDQGGGATGASVSLSASGWAEQSDGTYAQTVSVADVTADNQIIVDCALSGSDVDADIAVLEAWGCVNRCSQAAGSLTFYCYGDVPTVAIPLNVVVAG